MCSIRHITGFPTQILVCSGWGTLLRRNLCLASYSQLWKPSKWHIFIEHLPRACRHPEQLLIILFRVSSFLRCRIALSWWELWLTSATSLPLHQAGGSYTNLDTVPPRTAWLRELLRHPPSRPPFHPPPQALQVWADWAVSMERRPGTVGNWSLWIGSSV